MNRTIRVHTGRSYDIVVARGVLGETAAKCAPLFPDARRVCIVSDSNVAPLYADGLQRQFEEAGLGVSRFEFPAGESSKTLDTVRRLYDHLAERRFARTDFLAALGGGVTGDLCGFAAATYLRGLGFVQLPTSLLAQVDSSVGGKTGVDLPQGKNLVGAFWQPRLVLIDPDTLSTLPPPFLSDGMAEVIKTACIRDGALFDRLDADEPPPVEETVAACVAIKAGVVERDERETGERTLLNFGHTAGHALEKLHGFSSLTHGRAVAIGMVLLTQAAETAGLTAPGCAVRLRNCLSRYGLPCDDPAAPCDIAQAAAGDKKTSGGQIRLVLLHEIGDAYVYPATLQEFEALLANGRAGRKD